MAMTKTDKTKLKDIEQQLKDFKFNDCKLHNIELDIQELQDQLEQQQDLQLMQELNRLVNIKNRLQRNMEALRAAMDTLNDLEKKLINFRYFMQLSWQQVSNKLHMNVNALCNRLRIKILTDISKCL